MVTRLTSASAIANRADLMAAGSLSTFPIKQLHEAGFIREPLFVDVCKALETHLLHSYKWEGHLMIKKGVDLIGESTLLCDLTSGIADELGVLNEGEVFCQYENPAEPDEGPVVVKEVCIIMRAPALHPGEL